MTTPNDITQMPPVAETMQAISSSYDTVDVSALPNQTNSMSSFMLNSLADIRSAVDAHNRGTSQNDSLLNDAEILELRNGVEDNFYDVKSAIKPVNEYYWQNGTYEKVRIEALLAHYAQGYYQYTQLCSGSAAVVAVENWNKTNAGRAINCAGLVTSQKDIEYMMSGGFVPTTHINGRNLSETDPSHLDDIANSDTFVSANSRLYLQFLKGSLKPHELYNADDNGLNPFATEAAELGWHTPLKNNYLFSQVPWGGPTVGITYSHTADGDFTAGSQRFLVGAALGFKQPLYEFNFNKFSASPFVTPALMIGYAQNKFNFGDGVAPEPTGTLMVGANAKTGIELCSTDVGCLSAFYQYLYDRSLVGEPDYQAQGHAAGVSLDILLPDLSPKEKK